MIDAAINLFPPSGDPGLVRRWGIEPTAEQAQIHQALATRTVVPIEPTLRQAAAWLAALHDQWARHGGIPGDGISAELGEKSALLLRMARRHVPALVEDWEAVSSPLSGIEHAARIPSPHAAPHLVEALRQRIHAMALPLEAPAGTDKTWHDNRRRLADLILHDNPAHFLSWPVIQYSMFMNDSQIATAEWTALRQQKDYDTRWRPALMEDSFGAPSRTAVLRNSSNNLIHHAFNLLQFELHAGKRMDQLTSILEFGGGYGSMARLARRLGFRGSYVIFDLPEFSALQQFYLGSLSLSATCISTPEMLQGSLPMEGFDLFLATWSLSETPLTVRRQIAPCITASRHVLIAYQESFGNIDNVAYFAGLASQLKSRRLMDYPIPHLANNRYLVASPA